MWFPRANTSARRPNQKDFEEFFAAFPGPIEFELSDLSVMAEGKLGYGHGSVANSGSAFW